MAPHRFEMRTVKLLGLPYEVQLFSYYCSRSVCGSMVDDNYGVYCPLFIVVVSEEGVIHK